MDQLIHSSAIVDDGATLGAGGSLGQNVFVGYVVQVGVRV